MDECYFKYQSEMIQMINMCCVVETLLWQIVQKSL